MDEKFGAKLEILLTWWISEFMWGLFLLLKQGHKTWKKQQTTIYKISESSSPLPHLNPEERK